MAQCQGIQISRGKADGNVGEDVKAKRARAEPVVRSERGEHDFAGGLRGGRK